MGGHSWTENVHSITVRMDRNGYELCRKMRPALLQHQLFTDLFIYLLIYFLIYLLLYLLFYLITFYLLTYLLTYLHIYILNI